MAATDGEPVSRSEMRHAIPAEVRDVLERYFAGVDRRDFDLILSCFAEHATFASAMPGFAAVTGRAAIREFFERFPRRGTSIHSLSNVSILREQARIVTDSRAIAHLAGAEGGAILVRGLRYRDEWVNEGSAWLIARRDHEPLWQYAAAHHRPDLGERSS